MNSSIPAVSMRNISKSFGIKIANTNVSLDAYRGEILALLGENGSGKTTLMNMLSGIYYPDEGKIFIDGKEVTIASPKDAFSLGIGMIHQHFKLVDVLTASENIILGMKGKALLNMNAVEKKVKEICDQYGFRIDPSKKIYDMSVSEMQTVEIVKTLYRGAEILILDEPTAVLTAQETDKLFSVLKSMRENGKTIIIITHKMNEIMELSDRVAVLRKSRFIGEVLTKDTDPEELTSMMIGHHIDLNINRPDPVKPRPRLRVKDLTVVDPDGVTRLEDISFTAYAGEILGIAGISGSGQKELLESIAGLQIIKSGEIVYIDDDDNEESIVGKDPLDISKMGIKLSFVPEDRIGMGLVGNMDIIDNMMLRSFREGKSVFTNRKSPRMLAEKVVKELSVDTPGIQTNISRLSGGNVQKILVGREISSSPKVLMTAYAVRGLDINSSYTIYDLLNKQKQAGSAVIYVGEDLDVLVHLCDRILVLCAGKVSGIVKGKYADYRSIGLMMTSLKGGNIQ